MRGEGAAWQGFVTAIDTEHFAILTPLEGPVETLSDQSMNFSAKEHAKHALIKGDTKPHFRRIRSGDT